jgi:hypothetical protein
VFAHQLEQWKTDLCRPSRSEDLREEARSLPALKIKNQNHEREFLRKDRTLAEAAALFFCKKKFRALFE